MGIPGDDDKKNAIVVKSHDLAKMLLSDTSLSLSNLKLLDAYISRIDTRALKQVNLDIKKKLLEEHSDMTPEAADSLIKMVPEMYMAAYTESATVEIYRKDLAEMLGIRRLRKDTIADWCSALMDYKLKREKPDGSFIFVTLFPVSKYDSKKDKITLTCNVLDPSLRACIFDEDGSFHYFKYQLQYMARMTTIPAARLQLYLRQNVFRTKWIETTDNLKRIVNNREYQRTSIFIRDGLKPAIAQINSKTDLSVTIEPKRIVQRRIVEFEIRCITKSGSNALQNNLQSNGSSSKKMSFGSRKNVYLTNEQLSWCQKEWPDDWPSFEKIIDNLGQWKAEKNISISDDFSQIKKFAQKQADQNKQAAQSQLPAWYSDMGKQFESEEEREKMLAEVEKIKEEFDKKLLEKIKR